MNKNTKGSAVAGFILYTLAAVFCICFLTVFLAFCGLDSVCGSWLWRFGKLFTGVYGVCSIFIPVFLLTAAFQCFTRSWRVRNGVVLAGSVIPFFTLDAVEHICRMIFAENNGDSLIIKLMVALFTGGIVVAIEFLVLSILGDAIEKKSVHNLSKPKKTQKEEKFNIDDFFEEEIKAPLKAENEKAEDKKIIPEEEEEPSETEKTEEPEETEQPAETAETIETTGEENPFAHVFDDQDKIADDEETWKSWQDADDADTEKSAVVEPALDEVKDEPQTDSVVTDESANESSAVADDDWENTEIDDFSAENDFVQNTEFDELENDFEDENDGFSDDMDSDDKPEDTDGNSSGSGDSEVPAEDSDESVNEEAQENYDDLNDFEVPEDFQSDRNGENDGFDDSHYIDEENDVYDQQKLDEAKDYFSDDDCIADENSGDDGFGEDPVYDKAEDSELSDFVEKRNNRFASIFAEMGRDAAENPAPVQAEEDKNFAEENAEFEQSDEFADDPFADFEFDPTAEPLVDSNGELRTEKPAEKPAPAPLPVSVSAPAPKKEPPKLRICDYKIPVEGILQKFDNDEFWVIDAETKKKAEDLTKTLAEFNIEVKVTGIRKGPVVTMFEVLPAPGVNVNRIRNLQDNIALRLAATSVRIVSPIPGKSAVGIEIPNKNRAIVGFREIIEQQNPAFDKMAIPVILGKDISGEPRIIDLAKTPHLLIAGSTGSGKSVCVNSLILSILYKRNPNLVKLILIDPKVVELKLYNDIPHLLTPVITEPKKALQSLQYCICEMERRYALLDHMGVRDILSYNRRIEERKLMQEKLPYIVIIIDEFADLMATTGKELESNVARLAAMSRAVGIHLVLATQRPSVNVITGLIKANIPSRIAFMVASRTDSNIIIDQIGAEKLLGKGDMLYASATDPFPVRIQGTLVSDDEVEKVVEYVKQYGEPDYIDDEIFVDDDDEESDGNLGLFSDGDDPLYDQALEIVVQSGKASASYLQRRLKIGYNRAARLVEEMEERGIVGPQNGSKPREVIYVP